MNRKGEMQLSIGALIVAAIAVIVGAVLLQASAPSVQTITSTNTITNQTKTLAAANSYITLNGQAISGLVITNATGTGNAVPADNYTISNYVVNNGALEVRLTSLAGPWAGKAVNVSYVSEPFGYATDSGSRAVAPLILVFFALAILAVVVVAVGRTGVLDLIRG